MIGRSHEMKGYNTAMIPGRKREFLSRQLQCWQRATRNGPGIQKTLLSGVGLLGTLLLGGAWHEVHADNDTANHTVTIMIEEVARLGIDGGNLTLTIANNQVTAGASPVLSVNAADGIARLQYTSIIPSTGGTRKIMVSRSGGADFPNAAMRLQVAGIALEGAHQGSCGTLTTTPFDVPHNAGVALVSGIGTCWTGATAGQDGAKIGFNVAIRPDANDAEIAEIHHLLGGANFVSITYTLTDAGF